MDDEENLLDRWLASVSDRGELVCIYLHSGVRLTGKVLDWDDEIILLDGNNGTMPINRTYGFSSMKEAR